MPSGQSTLIPVEAGEDRCPRGTLSDAKTKRDSAANSILDAQLSGQTATSEAGKQLRVVDAPKAPTSAESVAKKKVARSVCSPSSVL